MKRVLCTLASAFLVAACSSGSDSNPPPISSQPATPTTSQQQGEEISPDLLAYAADHGIDVSTLAPAVQTVVTVLTDGKIVAQRHPTTIADQLSRSREIVQKSEASASGRPITIDALSHQSCDFGASGCSYCSGSYTLTDLFNQTLYLGSEICFNNGGTSVAYDDIALYEG
ncbi:MAG: hypothetical protein ACRELB_17885, partial [Polyangiaceae bacterium]